MNVLKGWSGANEFRISTNKLDSKGIVAPSFVCKTGEAAIPHLGQHLKCTLDPMAKKYYPLKSIMRLFHSVVNIVSAPSQPKASMRTRLPNGDFLTLTVWLGKSDPTAGYHCADPPPV